jgi:hypothetical protein
LNFRRSVRRKMTPSIRRKVEAELDDLYERARELAAIGAIVHEPDLIRRLPRRCPYEWDAIWQRDVMAEGGFDLSGGAEERPTKRRKRDA